MERGKKMKSKFSYKSKRTIIIAAIITVLLAGTATGVYFFQKVMHKHKLLAIIIQHKNNMAKHQRKTRTNNKIIQQKMNKIKMNKERQLQINKKNRKQKGKSKQQITIKQRKMNKQQQLQQGKFQIKNM